MIFLKYRQLKVIKKFYTKENLKTCIKFLFVALLSKNYTHRLINKSGEYLIQYQKKAALLGFLLNYFYKFNKSSTSKTKLARRCVFSNRSRGVLRASGLSRILFKEYLSAGLVPGYSKRVW